MPKAFVVVHACMLDEPHHGGSVSSNGDGTTVVSGPLSTRGPGKDLRAVLVEATSVAIIRKLQEALVPPRQTDVGCISIGIGIGL